MSQLFVTGAGRVEESRTLRRTQLDRGLEYFVNLLPTLRFLESLQKFPKVPLVYLSSGGAVYQPIESGGLKESSRAEPPSYYGAGKIAIENFINAFACQHNGRALILRPSNFYGPGQHFRRGFGITCT